MNVKPPFRVYLLVIFIIISLSFTSFSQSPGISAPGESFSYELLERGSGEVPQIGEWTRSAGPDESIVFTGHNLSSFSGVEEGKDSRFMVYASGGVKKEGKIQRLDGQKAIVTLDNTLPSWSMYLLQPGNDAGWGKAVAINKTEAWWAQNKVTAGMTSSVYGRNLAHGNVEGTSNSNVYIKPLGGGSGQWAQVIKVNPYKIEYRVPSSLTAGSYELWVHNGHGGELGWSAPVLVRVVGSAEHIQTKVWSAATINVKDYGARGDGQSDDRISINQALLEAGSRGATLYFPSGTYMVSGELNLRSNTRWLGETNAEGKPSSIIKLKEGFTSGGFGLMGGSNLNLVLFKNLGIDRNYQNLGGHELMDFRTGTMLWWDNCDLDVRQENALRLAGSSSHIYISGTTITGGKDQWGSTLFLDGVRQFFFNGSTIRMTKDCGAAINNKGVVEASMENCLVKDLDNSTTDGSGWGKGRIWSHLGAGGAAYHCYFSGNTGTGLGTRESGSNIPDPNSGEVFLWEANGTLYSGVPSSSTANTVSLGSIPQDRELCLAIIKGKGLGQFRRIVSNSGGVLTLDRAWEVQPDLSSVVVVGPYVEKIVLYKNQIDAKGKSYIANNGFEQATASAGIEPYGGCFDFVADGNTIEGLRKGLSTWAMQHGVSIDPTYFCLYVNNKITACRVGMHHAGEITTVEGIAMLGITYRHNRVESPVLSAIHSDFKVENQAVLTAVVYEHNNYSNTPSAFTTGYLGNPDPRANFGAGAIENQIFYKNSFQGGGSGIKITPKIMLRENLYQGLSSPYHGSLPMAAIPEAPYHVVEINASPGGAIVKTPFTLVNAGTASMTWTATTSAPWLKLSTNGGVILHEGEKSIIELSIDPKALSEGAYKTPITFNSLLGQSQLYNVIVKVTNSASEPVKPTVELTSPSAGSNFTAPAAITLTAVAADTDGSIVKVEFFNGTTKIGESTTAPYSFVWNAVPQGNYTLTAKATDNGGLVTVSQNVSITIASGANLAPTVELASPSAGSNFTTPASIILTAVAADTDGSIVKVEFFNGTTKIGESTTAPYSFVWNALPQGNYTLTAKATDNGGLVTVSQGVSITVASRANMAPTVELTSPSAGSNFTAPASITLTAVAADTDGSIVKVEFFNGTTKIGEFTTAPYSFVWNAVPQGNYTLTAKATDNGGLVTESQNVSIDVTTALANLAPTIKLTSPSAGSNFTAPASITLTAVAADTDGSIVKVEFFNGTTKIGESTTAPYSFVWNAVPQGNYTLTAKVTDNGGLVTVSQNVSITIASGANLAPTVELTSPSAGSNFTAPASITLTAVAADTDGSIVKVEFFNGTTKIGESTTAPYSFVWNAVPQGNYTLTAKATDNGGLVTVSQSISIDVTTAAANLAPTIKLTSPSAGSNFTAPAVITLTADAADADGSIVKVEFFNGTTKIGESTTAPYSFVWNAVPQGNYTLTARATDNGGLNVKSQTVHIKVKNGNNLAPTIKLTSPSAGSNFTAPASITLTAVAADTDGSIVKVEFFNGTTKIGESTTAPFSFVWNAVPQGNYTLTAKATDNGGLVTVSQSIGIGVTTAVANLAPTVELTSPSAGSNFTTPASIILTAVAADTDGSIVKVEFFNGPTKIGESTTAPYTFVWNAVPQGNYTLTAKATDNGGLVTVSQSISIGVTTAVANFAPTVELTSPSAGSNFTAPAAITLTAVAADTDGSIVKVEFFNGTTKIGESTTAPYSFVWNAVPQGNYTLTAKATDNGGLVTVSQNVSITIASGANLAPTVELTSPSAGSNFTTPASITLTAVAADTDGSIVKVEFFNGTTKIGESTTAPYSFVWNALPQGNYTLTAKATDNGGLVTESQNVTITVTTAVANLAPTIKLTSPSAGSNFTAPASIILTADAADTDGSIVKVEFFNGTTKIGESTTTPYTFVWNAVPQGNYTLTAKATDNGGLVTVSQSVSIGVTTAVANLAPTIKLTSPSAGSNFTAPASITLTAVAADTDGSIVKVEFFNGTTKIGESTTAPYSFVWNAVPQGNYTLTAKATDNGGLVTVSQSVSIDVTTAVANLAPTIKLTSPSAGSNFTASASITLTADAADTDGSIVKVEFFNGTTKIGESTTAPYSFVWNAVPQGNYTLTAKATDNGGLVTVSQSVSIDVRIYSNLAPTIKLTSPSAGSNFTAPASITLTADAADADGSIVKVEFFNGTTKIGESTTAPYSFIWNGVPQGNYTLTAKATDNGGLVTTSKDITISVNEPQPIAPTIALVSLTRGSFTAPAVITLTANASDADGLVSKVEFFAHGIKIGETTTAPYSILWNNVAVGIYTVIAKVTDNTGLTAVSQPMDVFVNKPNIAPVVKITSPTNNSIFTSPARITFNADASDADGSIVKVEFFNGDIKLGEDSNKPYMFTWNNVPVGTYNITARATDNDGTITISDSVQVMVDNNQKLRNYPNPFNSQTTIEFSLNRQAYVELQIFDMQGSLISTPFKGIIDAGEMKQIDFSGNGLPNGTYICRLIYNDGVSFFKKWLETKMLKIN